MKPKIYCWINSGRGTDWNVVIAMAEDGVVLGQHASSSVGFAKSDIGMYGKTPQSAEKLARMRERYPDGFDLVWLDDPRGDDGWRQAAELNRAAGAAAREAGAAR